MIKNRIIPVLLLQDNGLIKTQKFKDPKYVGDPINAIKIFNQKEVDEMVFLDVSASKSNTSPKYKLINDIASECFMPLAYGGGIKDLKSAEKIINIGIEKIIINNEVFKNPGLINELSKHLGNQSVVVSIDIKKTAFGNYKIFSYCTKKYHSINLNNYLSEVQNRGAGEIFINFVNNDGMMKGYDLDLLDIVLKIVKIPLVFCGGAGSIKDFKIASEKNNYVGLAAGAMFVFRGPHRAVLINYPSRKI